MDAQPVPNSIQSTPCTLPEVSPHFAVDFALQIWRQFEEDEAACTERGREAFSYYRNLLGPKCAHALRSVGRIEEAEIVEAVGLKWLSGVAEKKVETRAPNFFGNANDWGKYAHHAELSTLSHSVAECMRAASFRGWEGAQNAEEYLSLLVADGDTAQVVGILQRMSVKVQLEVVCGILCRLAEEPHYVAADFFNNWSRSLDCGKYDQLLQDRAAALGVTNLALSGEVGPAFAAVRNLNVPRQQAAVLGTVAFHFFRPGANEQLADFMFAEASECLQELLSKNADVDKLEDGACWSIFLKSLLRIEAPRAFDLVAACADNASTDGRFVHAFNFECLRRFGPDSSDWKDTERTIVTAPKHEREAALTAIKKSIDSLKMGKLSAETVRPVIDVLERSFAAKEADFTESNDLADLGEVLLKHGFHEEAQRLCPLIGYVDPKMKLIAACAVGKMEAGDVAASDSLFGECLADLQAFKASKNERDRVWLEEQLAQCKEHLLERKKHWDEMPSWERATLDALFDEFLVERGVTPSEEPPPTIEELMAKRRTYLQKSVEGDETGWYLTLRLGEKLLQAKRWMDGSNLLMEALQHTRRPDEIHKRYLIASAALSPFLESKRLRDNEPHSLRKDALLSRPPDSWRDGYGG